METFIYLETVKTVTWREKKKDRRMEKLGVREREKRQLKMS